MELAVVLLLGVAPRSADALAAVRVLDALCSVEGTPVDAVSVARLASRERAPVRTGDVTVLLGRLRSCVRVIRTDERHQRFACTYGRVRDAARAVLREERERLLAGLRSTPEQPDFELRLFAELPRTAAGRQRYTDILAGLRSLAERDTQLDSVGAAPWATG
jgi:hypothetical protein